MTNQGNGKSTAYQVRMSGQTKTVLKAPPAGFCELRTATHGKRSQVAKPEAAVNNDNS
jgi:hypothetical protein